MMCSNLGGGSGGSSGNGGSAGGNKTEFITQSKIDKMSEPDFLALMRRSKSVDIQLVSESQQRAMDKLTAQVKSKSSSFGETFTTPSYKINNDGNVEFEYKGTKTIKKEKAEKFNHQLKPIRLRLQVFTMVQYA